MDESLAKLKYMGELLKKLTSRQISSKEYYDAIRCIETAPSIEESIEVRDNPGEQRETVADASGEVCKADGHVESPAGTEPPITPMEFISGFSLSLDTDGGLGTIPTNHSDIFTGQSQCARMWRLLQDGQWHDRDEVQDKIYNTDSGGCAVPERISNINAKLKAKGLGKIESRVKKGSLWEWRYTEPIKEIAKLIAAG